MGLILLKDTLLKGTQTDVWHSNQHSGAHTNRYAQHAGAHTSMSWKRNCSERGSNNRGSRVSDPWSLSAWKSVQDCVFVERVRVNSSPSISMEDARRKDGRRCCVCTSMEDVWIIDGIFVASIVSDGRRCCLCVDMELSIDSALALERVVMEGSRENEMHGTRSEVFSKDDCFWGLFSPADFFEKLPCFFMEKLPGSADFFKKLPGFFEVKLPGFLMRGLAHSCRGMVTQRAARSVLTGSFLDDDEPASVLPTRRRGPIPQLRRIGACVSAKRE